MMNEDRNVKVSDTTCDAICTKARSKILRLRSILTEQIFNIFFRKALHKSCIISNEICGE